VKASRWLKRIAPYAIKRVAVFVIVLFVVSMVQPPYIPVTLPPRQEVRTLNPKVGVHTRLTDEVEAWKIQKSLAMVREMGAPWIVEYFPWPYIEPMPGEYDWEHTDLVIDHAENQGLQVIARLGMVPRWAQPASEGGRQEAGSDFTDTYLDQAYYDHFAHFAGVFSARYRGRVDHIIIWNEPNLSFEWGFRTVDPDAYTELLAVVYPVVHAANPDIIVLGGALAPTLELDGSPAGLDDLLYLRRMYEAGAGAYFDALAAHAYGLAFAPEIDPAEDLINFRRVELLREIMVEFGDAAKQIYVTEAGWNDHPRWTWSVRPAQRIQYTVDAYRWAAEHWPWCPVVAIWMFRTPQTLYNYQDYYAFVTPAFQERPIYAHVREYTGNAPHIADAEAQ
jgi:polysaccharide biosynthesis protein PslG